MNSRKKKKSGKFGTYLILIISVIIGVLYTVSDIRGEKNINELQKGIAEKIVRFHVIANSDSNEDQQLKLKVKEAVVEYIAPYLSESCSIDESKEILLNNQEKLISIAKDVIFENGYNYDVTAKLEKIYFPTKSYGNYTFPPGEYEAFNIRIGKSEGKNWWCVLYPPLCFIDISHGVVTEESDNMLENILTTDEYKAVSGEEKVQYRFKYLTFLNNIFN